MTIQEILRLSRREALAKHINELDAAYFELSGRHFCRVCPADVTTMLNELTRKYINMTQFRFKREKAVYRLEKGKSNNIKNDNMTDELAIAFLTINPERIELFSEFPENWKELINLSEDKAEEIASSELTEDDEAECLPCLRNVLEDMKLKDLKEAYPNIKVEFGQKKSDFIDKIIEAEESNKQ